MAVYFFQARRQGGNPNPTLNPNGSKGMDEIALIGFATAVANAVYNAMRKRMRDY